jgi:1-acyl-sn-glycerol-3-phosphate acyltransferase
VPPKRSIGNPPPPAKRPEDRISIQVLRAIDTLFARVYHNLQIVQPAHLPRHGAGILVCNHVSSVDPILLQSAVPQRLVIWMMAKEYMDMPGFGSIFRTLGVIPVDRNGRDSTSLRNALRALKDGRMLGIFPEGRFATGDYLMPFHTGAALMAIKAKVPVYPAYQDGSQRGQGMHAACLLRQRAAVAFGPPVEFDRSSTSKENLDAATAAIRDAIAALKPMVRASGQGGLGKYSSRNGNGSDV